MMNEYLKNNTVDEDLRDTVTNNNFTDFVKRVKKMERNFSPLNINHPILLSICLTDDTKFLKYLLENTIFDPSDANNRAIEEASSRGKLKMVKILLKDKRVNPACSNNEALVVASQNDHPDVVEILLSDPRVDPTVYNNYSISISKDKGYNTVYELLLNDKRVYDRLKEQNDPLYKESKLYRKEKINMIIEN